ncbi:MAG: carboxypeptidase-like regulatory domain-containing protein, partial [Ferruginibacter sp.]
MKLAIIIVLATTLQVQAIPVIGQHVTLNLKHTEIRKVLKLIEGDGYYRFLYNSDLKGLKNKVDLYATGLTITETLSALLPGSDLNYKMLDNNVIVILSANADENDKIKIIGKITGENGEILSGASVLEKGTGNGVFADNSGSYTITAESEATLLITNVGYEPVEIKVNGRSVIDVKLKPSAKLADELVIIGYGSAS